MDLASYLMKIRSDNGLTYRDLARKSGVSHGTIQDIENGKTQNPGFKTIELLAKALNIPVTKFYLASQGIDPDKSKNSDTQESLMSEFLTLFEELPLDSKRHLFLELSQRMVK